MDRDVIKEHLERCLDRVDLPELGMAQRGKVRDCYTVGDTRVIVSTDRISAFDRVFVELIPFKGQVLNQLAAYFLRQARAIVPIHLIDDPDPNVTIAREARPYAVEVIVRGYLAGSAWRDYEAGRFEASYGFARCRPACRPMPGCRSRWLRPPPRQRRVMTRPSPPRRRPPWWAASRPGPR